MSEGEELHSACENYRSALESADFSQMNQSNGFEKSLALLSGFFSTDYVAEIRPQLKHVWDRMVSTITNCFKCGGILEFNIQCKSCGGCYCEGCKQIFPSEDFNHHLDNCTSNLWNVKKSRKKYSTDNNSKNSKRQKIQKISSSTNAPISTTNTSVTTTDNITSKNKSHNRISIIDKQAQQENSAVIISAYEDILTSLTTSTISFPSFADTLLQLTTYTPEEININRAKLARIYAKYKRATTITSIPSNVSTETTLALSTTTIENDDNQEQIMETVEVESDDEESISLGENMAPIFCIQNKYGGCTNPTRTDATRKYCSGCSRRLWTKPNKFSLMFSLGQKCTFLRIRTLLPEDGVVVHIFNSGNKMIIKYQGLYSDDRWNEEHFADNIFLNRENQLELMGKRPRAPFKPFVIEYKQPTPRPMKLPPVIPPDIPADGEPHILCASLYGGCGARNALHLKVCHGCKCQLKTKANKLKEVFQLGQNAVYSRPKCGQIWDVIIARIPGENDPMGREIVKVKYALPDYSMDKFDEFANVDCLFSSRKAMDLGSRKRLKPQQFDFAPHAYSHQSYSDLCDGNKRLLDDIVARKLANQNREMEEEEEDFLVPYRNLEILDLDEVTDVFDVEDYDSTENDDYSKKFKCECGGFYTLASKDKHKKTNDNHLMFIANKFAKLFIPYRCLCSSIVKNRSSCIYQTFLAAHLKSTEHKKFVRKYITEHEVPIVVPLDSDDLREPIIHVDDEPYEGFKFDRELRIRFKFTPIDDDDLNIDTLLSCFHFASSSNVSYRLDRCRQKALLIELFFWIKDYNSRLSTRIELTVIEAEDLILFCPISIEELRQLKLASSLIDRGGSIEVIKAIRMYLEARSISTHSLRSIEDMQRFKEEVYGSDSFLTYEQMEQSSGVFLLSHGLMDIATLRNMKLTLPLTFYQFRHVMQFAYDLVAGKRGGRDIVEKVVGGLCVKDGIRAMYGGVNEEFVEQVMSYARMNSQTKFVDIGSGIGQVAATVGCECIGIEIERSRHEMAEKLLQAFDDVLVEIGVSGGIGHLVSLKCSNFISLPRDIAEATVIMYNNYGPWFTADDPGKDIDFNNEFSAMIKDMDTGGQIFTFNPLILAEKWLDKQYFTSGKYATSWTNNKMPVCWYTLKSKSWVCGHCSAENVILDADCCYQCQGRVKKERSKPLDGNNRCNRS